MGVWQPGPGATEGDDVFTGDATDETADGLVGNDTLSGNGGDDTLEGGPGNDVVDGGLGIDTASYATAPGVVIVNLWDGAPQDTGSAGFDTLISIENAIGSMFDDIIAGTDNVNILRGGAGGDLLSGLAGSDSLFGGDGADQLLDGEGDDFLFGGDGNDLLVSGAGDDTLEGGLGDDTLDGSSGLDTASYATAAAPVFIDLNITGPQMVGLDTEVDTLASIENVIGSAFGDFLTGGPGDGSLLGGDGGDFLDGHFGDDVLDGGAGADLLDGGFGDDVLRGGADDDAIVPGSGSDLLDGGEGADVFRMTDDVGVDAISGGPDLDTVDYLHAEAGVIVQLSGYATTNDAAHTLLATLTGVEYVHGSLHNDALIGDAADNLFVDSGGFDWLVGAGGDDLFILSGGGFDRVFGGTQAADAGFDTIDYRIAGGVIVQLSGYAATNEAIPVLIATFTGIEAANGTIEDDVLVGDASDNILQGRFGPDWLVGGDGDDTFVQVVDTSNVDRIFGGTPASDSGVDTIDYSQSNFTSLGGVTLQLSGYATNGATLLATFSGIENAVGTRFDDALIGTAGNNRIAGGAGSDWLVGAGGDDTFVQSVETGVDRLFGGTPGADVGVDTVDYSSASAGVVVQLSGYATTNGGGNITLATFTGIENTVGTTFNDALIGNAANNRLTGGQGGDWLIGGGGADTFVYQGLGDGAGDSIRDFSQAQFDRIDLSAVDANPLTGADDAFVFATTRHAGVVGEAVVSNFGGSSLVSLYVDGDSIADMTIAVVHQQGLVMAAGDFVL